LDRSRVFKELYADEWKPSNKRELMVRNLFERHKIKIQKYGFMAQSDQYTNMTSGDPGKSDFLIRYNNQDFLLEVTGTDSERVKPEYDIWIRPDKIIYAKRSGLLGFVAHVLTAKDLIRFVYMNRLDESKTICRNLRGVEEYYVPVHPSHAINFEELIKCLEKE